MLLAIATIATGCKKDKEEDGKLIELPDGDQVVTGNLSKGEIISDLSWAWNSSMACFVEPAKEWFEGNHVLYQIDLPEKSTIDISVVSTNASDDIAVYAYSKAAGDMTVPQEVTSSVSCEASPSTSNAVNGAKTVSLNAINNPYSIIIGVAGAKGLTSGDYTLTIDVES